MISLSEPGPRPNDSQRHQPHSLYVRRKAARWVDEDMADVITHKAVTFINKDKDRPFFLYVGTHDIDVPRDGHPQLWRQKGDGTPRRCHCPFDWSQAKLSRPSPVEYSHHTLVLLSSDNGPVVDDGYQDGAVEKLGDHRPAGPLPAASTALLRAELGCRLSCAGSGV